MAIEVELTSFDRTGEGDFIGFITEVGGKRTFSFIANKATGKAIRYAFLERKFPQPQVIDVYCITLEKLGITIEKVVITDLGTASIWIKHGKRLISIEMIPSDAIAIAMTADRPIFIKPDAFERLIRLTTLNLDAWGENGIRQ